MRTEARPVEARTGGAAMPPTVRALSLRQPWASLLVLGEKTYETRSWQTNIRGDLVIHASNTFGQVERHYAEQPLFKRSLQKHGVLNAQLLPRGALLGIVRVVDCQPTAHFCHDDDQEGEIPLTEMDRAFGNWINGRWAWRCEVVEVFKKPITFSGQQGFFAVPASLIRAGK